MSSTSVESERYTNDTQVPNWRTLATAGGVLALLGLLAIAFPLVTGLSIAYGLGALLVLGGIVHGAHAATARGWNGAIWQGALAVASVVAGAVVLANPAFGLVSVTLAVIAYLLVDAVAELWASLRMRGRAGRGWVAASGALSLVLAGFLWAGFPADAAWVVGALVGISLIATGLSTAMVAYAGRRLGGTDSRTGQPRGA